MPSHGKNRLTLIVAASTLFVVHVAHADTARKGQGPSFVLGKNQESNIGELLRVGRELGDSNCVAVKVAIEKDHVDATFDCLSGRAAGIEARIRLVHPLANEGFVPAGENFGIVEMSKDVPKTLVRALVRRIRDHEEPIEWTELTDSPGTEAGPDDGGQERHGPAPDPNASAVDAVRKLVFDEGRPREGLSLAVALASRTGDRRVIGALMVAVPDSDLDEAEVEDAMLKADERPDDEVLQLVAGLAAHYYAHSYPTWWPGWKDVKERYYRLSIRYLERTLPDYGDIARVWIYLAASHYRIGDRDKALEMLHRAEKVTGEDQDPDIWYVHAMIMLKQDVRQSIADLEKYIRFEDSKSERSRGREFQERYKSMKVRRLHDYLLDVAEGRAEPDDMMFEGGAIDLRYIAYVVRWHLAYAAGGFLLAAVVVLVLLSRRRRSKKTILERD